MLSKKRTRKHRPLIAKAKKVRSTISLGLPSSLRNIFAQDQQMPTRIRTKPTHAFQIKDPLLFYETESNSDSSKTKSESDYDSDESVIIKPPCDFLRSDSDDECVSNATEECKTPENTDDLIAVKDTSEITTSKNTQSSN